MGQEVFKSYRNPDAGEFNLFNPARPAHAKIDFNETVSRGGLKLLDLFFSEFSTALPVDHPYWTAYSRLYHEYKEREKQG